MQEHEVIALELEQNRQRQLDEIRMLQKEVQERKSRLSKEKTGQVEEIRKMMKELEQNKNDKPEVRKMKEARLLELKNEFDRIQNKMQDKQEAQEDILREKLRELEKQSQNQNSEQRARQADLQNLREKMIRQQKELMIEEKKQMQLYREQLKSMEQELRKEEKEQRKPKDESGFKMDPRKQGLVDGVTKKVYKVEKFTVHNAVATVEHSAESTHEYEWEPFQTVYVNQDTVPARKARIGSPGKPAKVFSKPKAALAPNKEPRPGAEDRSKLNRQKREESNDRRVEERRQLNKRVDEKRQLAKRSDRKNLFAEKPGKRPLFEKKPSRIKVAPKSPAKPVQKLKPVPRSEKSPVGSEGEQENEETADISVNGDK